MWLRLLVSSKAIVQVEGRHKTARHEGHTACCMPHVARRLSGRSAVLFSEPFALSSWHLHANGNYNGNTVRKPIRSTGTTRQLHLLLRLFYFIFLYLFLFIKSMQVNRSHDARSLCGGSYDTRECSSGLRRRQTRMFECVNGKCEYMPIQLPASAIQLQRVLEFCALVGVSTAGVAKNSTMLTQTNTLCVFMLFFMQFSIFTASFNWAPHISLPDKIRPDIL